MSAILFFLTTSECSVILTYSCSIALAYLGEILRFFHTENIPCIYIKLRSRISFENIINEKKQH